METVYSSETAVNFCKTTCCHIPKDITPHSHCLQNPKSNTDCLISHNNKNISCKRIENPKAFFCFSPVCKNIYAVHRSSKNVLIT